MRFLKWIVYFVLLGVVAGLFYFSSFTKEKAKENFGISLPSNFYAKEYNRFAKNIFSPTLTSIIVIDNKTFIAVGYDGAIIKSKDGGESFKVINSPTKEHLNSITVTDNKLLLLWEIEEL